MDKYILPDISGSIITQNEKQNQEIDDTIDKHISLYYPNYKHAAIAAIRLVPYIQEHFNGVNKVSYNKKLQKIDIKAGNKYTFNINWAEAGGITSIGDTYRNFAFETNLLGYAEFIKLDKIQVQILEDPKAKIISLIVNQIVVLKSTYKKDNIRNLRELTTTRDRIIKNPTSKLLMQNVAHEYILELVSLYNVFEVPDVIKSLTHSKGEVFKSSNRITLDINKLIQDASVTKPIIHVGVSLDSTSDRKDRFDHDD